MSGIPVDDAPAPADDNDGPGIDADAFSPVLDPDYVTGEAPKDRAAGSEAQPDPENRDRGNPEETDA
jgi:hypothetical protein